MHSNPSPSLQSNKVYSDMGSKGPMSYIGYLIANLSSYVGAHLCVSIIKKGPMSFIGHPIANLQYFLMSVST